MTSPLVIALTIQYNEPSKILGYDWLVFWGFVAGIVSAIAALLALWPYVRQRITERRIIKGFGVDLYLPQIIRDATRLYIRPDAASIDPSQEIEERSNRVLTREDLFRAVQRFLDDNSRHRHMLLLADSGMGKSAFVLNFYAYNKRRFARKRYRLAVVPLGHIKAIEKIREIQNKRETIIFLDAFDEDPKARGDYWGRLKLILEECSEFNRILITCRTQFFPKDDAIPVSTGIVKVGPRIDEAHYDFWRLYISPFSDEQVEKYLRRRFRFNLWKRMQARKIILKIPLLTIRPMLLTNVPDIISSKINVKYSWELYELMVRAWYKREQSWWHNAETLQIFSEEVAIRLYISFIKDKSNFIPREELNSFIEDSAIPLDEWNATTRSLLHRDAAGNFKFAHRSIMEYLFVKRFLEGDKRCMSVDWTAQMQTFLWEMFNSHMEVVGALPFHKGKKKVKATSSDRDVKESLLNIKNKSKLNSIQVNNKIINLLSGLLKLHPARLDMLLPILEIILNPSRTNGLSLMLLKCVRPAMQTIVPAKGRYEEEHLRSSFAVVASFPENTDWFENIGNLLADVTVPSKPLIGAPSIYYQGYDRQHRVSPTLKQIFNANTKSTMVLPILLLDKLWGVLICQSTKLDAFSLEDVNRVTDILQDTSQYLKKHL